MYEKYEKLYPFQLDESYKNKEHTVPFLNTTPYMPGGRLYMQMLTPELKAYEFTSWRDETLSWHLTCSVSAGLNPSPIAVVKGPDAAKFLKKYTVNNIDKFPVGTIKHGLMCVESGHIAAQGVILHTDEDTYEAHWLSPHFDAMFASEQYDAELEVLTGKRAIFQTQGPRSLEMMEHAAEEDLHDLKYGHFRNAVIAGKPVRILRFGMYGCLGYEVHCATEDAQDVYCRIIEAGQSYGVRRLGWQAYLMCHTPGGSQQIGYHFLPAMDPKLVAMLSQKTGDEREAKGTSSMPWVFTGSLDGDYNKRIANPFELGLGYVVNFDHDFVGKEALLNYKNSPNKRNLVTLKWNYEDLGDIYMSQFRDEEPYFPIDFPGKTWSAVDEGTGIEMDKVLDAEGREIGYSSGRTTDYWHRAMVSLAVIEESSIKPGAEVTILWGNTGTRQKKVRATIERFPFNEHLRNKTFDVETIPHYVKK